MKSYKDIIQQTEEWYRLRYGKIGGSTLKELMANKSVQDTAIYSKLLSARFEDYEYEENFQSFDMERGVIYEPVAREMFEDVYNLKVDLYGWLEMDNGIAGISPDGIIGDKFAEAVEIKCPNRITHMTYIRNPMSMIEEYIWQVVEYFVVIDKLKTLYFVSYRPENTALPLVVQKVNRKTIVQVSAKDTDSIENLVKRAKYKINQLDAALEKDVAFFSPKF